MYLSDSQGMTPETIFKTLDSRDTTFKFVSFRDSLSRFSLKIISVQYKVTVFGFL